MLFLALLPALAASHDFTICPGEVDHLSLNSVSLSPDEPSAGERLKVDFSGTPDQDVAGGKAVLAIKLFGVKLTDVTFDICTDMGISCPHSANVPFTASISYVIPSVAPAGLTVDVQVDVTNSTGSKLTCVDLDVKVGTGKHTTTEPPAITTTAPAEDTTTAPAVPATTVPAADEDTTTLEPATTTSPATDTTTMQPATTTTIPNENTGGGTTNDQDANGQSVDAPSKHWLPIVVTLAVLAGLATVAAGIALFRRRQAAQDLPVYHEYRAFNGE